ncbi:MAG: ATP-binding protein, partial [bacterium]
AVVLAFVSVTNLMIDRYEIDRHGNMTAIYVPALPIFILYFSCFMGGLIYYLAKKIKLCAGIQRLQHQYVLLGISLFTVLAISTGLVAPLFGLTGTELASLSPTFGLVWAIFIAYAIARYHLMDITIIIKRTTIYALLTTSITAGYISVVLLSNWLFGGIMGLQTLIPAMVAALLSAFAFAPLKEGIQAFIDKTLFKKRYDHRKILSDLSRILTSIYSLEELFSLILRVITKAMGVERGSIFLPQYPGNAFIAMAHHGNDGTLSDYGAIAKDSPLIRKLQWRRDLVIREQLCRLPQSQETHEVVALLENLKADICIPIFSKDTLTGVLFLGSKETGETFTLEDIEMFNTLSHHIAVAIENAQLYTKVEESKIYQEILLNNLTSGVIAIDLTGRITAFNARAEKMLGVKAVDVLGADLSFLAPELRDVLLDTLRNRVSVSAEEVVVKAETDKDLPLAVSSSIFNSQYGKTLGALIVFSDLTERKVLEMEMRRADRLASLGTLAAGMAHEIKNPLVALKTFTQLLPERYSDREFRENFSRLANQEVDRINYLVEQLLDFARPSLPSFRKTDISEILNNTLLLLRSKLAEQNIEVKEEIEKRSLMIMADGDQLKQVLLNIVINALQAMEEKGVLTIKAGVRYATESGTVSARGEGPARRLHRLWSQDCVFIEISDTGKGISPKDLPHLFDPFFTTKESGAGLGLAIAHSIIEEHGGIVDVKSALGEGTTFLITMPMLPQGTPVSVP